MAMPRVGDGTGVGSKPPTEQALTADQNAKPERSSGGAGDNGSGPQLVPGQNRPSSAKGY